MRRPVHWSHLPVEHLAGITLYISRTSPLYADRMVERILRRVNTLGDFPEIGLRASEAENENVREVFENPYRILYLAQPTRIDHLGDRPRASEYRVADLGERSRQRARQRCAAADKRGLEA